MKKKVALVATLTVVFATYLSTVSNTIYGGDAGDLVASILDRGFAHPPGYPLYSLLGIIFSLLPVASLSPAGKITLVSTLSSVFSLFFVYLIIRQISEKEVNIPLVITVILSGAFNYLIWLYSVIPEVFPLNALIILSIYYLSIRYYKSAKTAYLYLLSFMFGLGVSHHHTFILIAPALFYLIWQKRKVIKFAPINIGGVFLLMLAGLSPYLYVVYAYCFSKAEIIWGKTDSLSGLLDLILRKGYGTFVAGPFVSNIPIHRFLQIKNLFLFVINDFSYFYILIFILALAYYLRLEKKSPEKKIFNSLWIALATFGPVFFFYANFPLTSKFLFATLERFFISFYFFCLIILYFGILKLFDIFKRFFSEKYIYVLFLVVVALYPLATALKNYPLIVSLKNDQTAENLGKDIIDSTGKKSILLLSTDTILFNTQYYFKAKYTASDDKIIVHENKFYTDYYALRLKKLYPDLKIDNNRKTTTQIFIKDNLDKYDIYANAKYRLDGLDGYSWKNQGLLYRLVKDGSSFDEGKAITDFWTMSKNKNLAASVKNNDLKFRNFFTADILRVYSTAHQNSGYYFLNENKYRAAYKHIEEAILLDEEDVDSYYLASLYYKKIGDCRQAENKINIALSKSDDALYIKQLEDIGKNCFFDEVDKKRVDKAVEKFNKDLNIPLKNF